jgi:hypothetical protein
MRIARQHGRMSANDGGGGRKKVVHVIHRAASDDLKPRRVRGFLSLPPPALGECCHCPLAGRRVAVREHVILTILKDEDCPHPRRSYWRGSRLEDAADIEAIGEHVIIVIAPLTGWARGRRAFQSEVVLLHRNTVARSFWQRVSRSNRRTGVTPTTNANRIGSPPRSRFLLRTRLRMRAEERFRPCLSP